MPGFFTIGPMATPPRPRDHKFAERRAELGEAALTTLAELGYARTSLREIAQNSEFSHGVLHYYFTDKLDLILCSVRQYKARCVKRYDEVTASATSFDELLDGFVTALGDTLRDEAPLHRLWYDLRAQSLFEQAFREGGRNDAVERAAGRFSTCRLAGCGETATAGTGGVAPRSGSAA